MIIHLFGIIASRFFVRDLRAVSVFLTNGEGTWSQGYQICGNTFVIAQKTLKNSDGIWRCRQGNFPIGRCHPMLKTIFYHIIDYSFNQWRSGVVPVFPTLQKPLFHFPKTGRWNTDTCLTLVTGTGQIFDWLMAVPR